jgi:hypothetical protein
VAVINPRRIHEVRLSLQQAIAAATGRVSSASSTCTVAAGAYQYNSEAIARRSWRDVCLHYALLGDTSAGFQERVADNYRKAPHMTERMGALRALVHHDAPHAAVCLADFHGRFANEALVIDSWFAVQATSPAEGGGSGPRLARMPAFHPDQSQPHALAAGPVRQRQPGAVPSGGRRRLPADRGEHCPSWTPSTRKSRRGCWAPSAAGNVWSRAAGAGKAVLESLAARANSPMTPPKPLAGLLGS